MKLYDNDSHRDAFTELVYDLLNDDPTWDRANQIIESFDSAPAVEVPDTTLGGTYVNIEWLKRAEAELKKCKELAQRPHGGPCDAAIEIVKPAPHTYLKPCRICGNTEIVYEKYQHGAGPRWRCWCTKCLARCGNAVPPPFATALVRANLPEWCGKEITTMSELENTVAS